jgi:lincosamide nucleotidyltransferase A/C/D/E
MATSAADVRSIISALRRHGIDPGVSGGWGVDALAGRQTRDHRDLDLSVPADHLDRALFALTGLGFAISVDWLPVRVELSARQQWVDLHPVRIRPDGSAWQAGLDTPVPWSSDEVGGFVYPADGWAEGSVDGLSVRCISADLQRQFHAGYPPRDIDLHDLDVLASLPEQVSHPDRRRS